MPEKTCPNCGHCPTCGQSPLQPYPWSTQSPPIWWGFFDKPFYVPTPQIVWGDGWDYGTFTVTKGTSDTVVETVTIDGSHEDWLGGLGG